MNKIQIPHWAVHHNEDLSLFETEDQADKFVEENKLVDFYKFKCDLVRTQTVLKND